MVEIAMPADGSEKHLPEKPIKGAGVNLDSDEEVMAQTDKSGGKWRYFASDGKLLAEADAPGSINADIVSQWCSAVRAKAKRELTQEDIDRKMAARENKTKGGIVLPEGVEVEEPTVDEPSPVLEDNPDAYVDSKLSAAANKVKAIQIKNMELEQQKEELDAELSKAVAEQSKWIKMKEALSDED